MKKLKFNSNVPLFVHVEITERCPLKYPQCYCDYVTGNGMDFNLYSKLVSQITEMGIDSVLLTGGEPLIYPNIFNAIMLLKENNITVSIASSGYGIDRQFAKKLKEIGTYKIFISLNRSNHNIHNLSRDKFEVSIHAIKTLSSIISLIVFIIVTKIFLEIINYSSQSIFIEPIYHSTVFLFLAVNIILSKLLRFFKTIFQ